MRKLIASRAEIGSTLAILWLPLGLWAMLWLSISAGDPAGILNPGSPVAFIRGLSALFPFAAGASAAIIIGVKLFRRSPRGFGLFGPLALAAVYGLVGLVAAIKSPSGAVALWWAALYLSVPLVLWGVVWSADPLEQLRRLVNTTWLIVILAALALIVVSGLYLDLIEKLLNPTQFLGCQSSGWLNLSGGLLRETGVGRYAGIAGIIAISGLWQGRWRPTWLVVLLTSMILLQATGARGSLVGFAAGASLVLLIYLLYAGQRALWAGLLITLVLMPLIWSTGAPQIFLEQCLLRRPPAISGPPQAAIKAPATASSLATVVDPATAVEALDSPEQTAPPSAAVAAPATSVDSAGSPGQTAPPSAAVAAPATSVDSAGSSNGSETQVATPKIDLQTPGEPSERGTSLEPITQGHVSLGNATVEEPLATQQAPLGNVERGLEPAGFFTFTGRTAVWLEGWNLIKSSPLIGFGFHADRLLLGTHMHNSILHALIQAGFFGAIPFVAAVIFAWVIFFRMVRKLNSLPRTHKHLVIQCGGVLAFLTMRSFPESSGAFFGIDWLILAPILFYLQVINSNANQFPAANPTIGYQ